MNADNDPFWDDLGVTWTAVDPDINVIKPRLKARLRRHSLLIAVGVAIGMPLSIAGLALAAWTLWVAWTSDALNFYARGVAVAAISLLIARAVALMLPVRAADAARSLTDMLDLTIMRAKRTGLIIRLGLYSCLVAAALGLVGAAIRTHFESPPQMSPIVDLGILAALALILITFGRHNAMSLGMLRALRGALANGGEEPSAPPGGPSP